MISYSFDEKGSNIEEGKAQINSKSDDDLIFVKTMIDSCLEKQVRKATIISGLRGGFIYERGEYYFPGSIPDGSYGSRFISNLDLNWNNLESRALVHSQSQVYSPGLNSNSSLFSHSIKEDFEEFISTEFMNCIAFDEYVGVYEFNYTDYIGNIELIKFSDDEMVVSEIDALVGESIKVNYIDEDLIGEVVAINNDNYRVKFDNLNYLRSLDSDSLDKLSVLNLNKSLDIDIVFNEEDIRASINYPVRVGNEEFNSLYENSEVILNVRFKKLLELSESLLKYKYSENKSVNYMDPDNLLKGLDNSFYFKEKGLSGIHFKKKIINNTLSEKKYLYSIIDEKSKILGNDFVFNFGYENIAPIINFTAADPRFNYNTRNDIITLITAKNTPLSYDLEPHTTEDQYFDHYIKYFEEQDYGGPGSDAKFHLSSDGRLEFTGFLEKIYSYDITVTDTEARREHAIKFITGLPDNTDNKKAKDCFSFVNSHQGRVLFPVHNDFANDIFGYVDEGSGEHKVYAYTQHSEFEDIENSRLYFSNICSFDSVLFEVDAKLSYGEQEDTIEDIFAGGDDGLIEIPEVDVPVEVEVLVKQDGNLVVNPPFKITIYPVSCLGPGPKDILDKSWDMTCCDVGAVAESIENDNPQSFVGTKNNIYDATSGHYAIDDDFVFLYDLKNADRTNFDYEENILWDTANFGPRATSTYKGHIEAKCNDGKYPVFEKNLQDLEPVGSPTKSFGEAQRVENNGFEIAPDFPVHVTLGEDKAADVCEFGYGSNLSIKFFFESGLILSAGLIDYNTAPGTYGLTPIPDEERYDNLYVLCDDEEVSSEDGGLSWMSSAGRGSRGKVYVSKQYCSQGISGADSCDGRVGSPTLDYKIDEPYPKCIDSFWDGLWEEINDISLCKSTDISCNSEGICVSPPPCCTGPDEPYGCVTPPDACVS